MSSLRMNGHSSPQMKGAKGVDILGLLACGLQAQASKPRAFRGLQSISVDYKPVACKP